MTNNKPYPGGKGGKGVFQTLINQMPPHTVYIECFLGLGSVLKKKRPAERTIAIDINPNVVAGWSGNEIPNLELIQGDATTFLKGYRFKGDELIYADPPYLIGTRSYKKAIYKNEFTALWRETTLLEFGELSEASVVN